MLEDHAEALAVQAEIDSAMSVVLTPGTADEDALLAEMDSWDESTASSTGAQRSSTQPAVASATVTKAASVAAAPLSSRDVSPMAQPSAAAVGGRSLADYAAALPAPPTDVPAARASTAVAPPEERRVAQLA